MSVVNRKSTKSLMEGTIRDAGAGCEKAGEKLGDVELAGNENVDTQGWKTRALSLWLGL